LLDDFRARAQMPPKYSHPLPLTCAPRCSDPTWSAIDQVKVDGLKVVCIGAGYVGGPTMAIIAKSESGCAAAPPKRARPATTPRRRSPAMRATAPRATPVRAQSAPPSA